MAASLSANAGRHAGELARLYGRLSPLGRRAVWLALALEGVLILLTERDIERRPSTVIRGPKLLWRAVATQNFVGPLAYYTLGRKRSH